MLDALLLQGGYTATVVSLGVASLGAACGLAGTFALLRGRVLAADAIAHAALPGFAAAFLIAFAIGLPGRTTPLLAAGAIAAGALALVLVRILSETPRLKPDAAIGAVLAGAYALGIVLLSIVQALPAGGQAGLSTYLLGSTAGMLAEEAITNAVVALVVAGVVLALFKEFGALAFDATHARLTGLPAGVLDATLLAVLLVLAVAALRSTGAILFVALLAIPAATARFWTERLPAMALVSSLLGALGAHVGAALSATLPRLPTGPAIVLVLAGAFALSLLIAPRRGLLARALADRRRADALRAALAADRAGRAT